jgi:signal transduction histidine kinase
MALGVSLLSIAVTAAMTYVLYGAMQRVFRLGLNERLEAMAAVAALNFDAAELDRIAGRESVNTPAYRTAVLQLQRIRQLAPNVQYAYILRRTVDPNTMQFVADADSLHPDQPVDLNGDGVIDDEDALTYPGDPYDASPFPEFRAAAFSRPFVDPDFTTSQWGVFLSGTAPIPYRDASNRAVNYVVGLDLNVTQYQLLLRQVVLPFLGFMFFLLTIISLQAFALRKLWQRQVRQLAEIDRQKDELISIVSHQLASPLSSIQWSLQDLIGGDFGPLTREQQSHLQDDVRTTANLLDLTSLLLDVSRIELGRLKMHQERQDLAVFFREIIAVIQPKAEAKHIRFLCTLPHNLPEGTLDKRLTHMTVENLLTNAVKYTPPGGTVEFTVALRANLLTCSVRDTGIGIPAEDQDKIFGKLFRASNVQREEGNGFGLYVAKGAIEQQGGKIWFESQAGRGTTFHVELPA